ncbi:MAG: EAL domain-containing protein [Lachnospiraceae bacterium]|nr:EAL domain-containing protein [Lachnospiraceae bacterium]
MPDYEIVKQKTESLIRKFIRNKAEKEDYREIYDLLGVVKVSLMMGITNETLSRNMSPEFVVETDRADDGSIVLFDTGAPHGAELRFLYSRITADDTTCTWYIDPKISPDSIDKDEYSFIADKMYMLQSIINMRRMLKFARNNDAQSGIPNGVGIKVLFSESREANPDINYSVLFINLQNFNYINESIGSRGGDEVLIQYSRRLTLFVEPDEGVCRMGGDNFVFYVKPENLDRLIGLISTISIGDLKTAPEKTFILSAWIGVSANDKIDEDIATRIEHASIACSIAKQRLKQPVVYFSDKLRAITDNNQMIASIFMPALSAHEFLPYFQPKVDMRTGELSGFETLCRWKHDGNFIFPDQFIPVIDRLGLTYELDMEMLRVTCQAIRQWKEMGLNPPIVSVNFSRKDIFVPNIEREIGKVAESFGITPDRLEIEITETSTESEYARIIDFTGNLKSMGFRIAIDDFGTGYSSISLIHNINADVIKIDKSFVTAVNKDSKTEILVESIIHIGSRLDMELVAEGVETAKEGRILMDLGCHIAQGYYYGKPSDFDTATQQLKDNPFKPIPDEDPDGLSDT